MASQAIASTYMSFLMHARASMHFGIYDRSHLALLEHLETDKVLLIDCYAARRMH